MSVTHEGSARDYEQKAEETRHRLADTLDELHDRLTPGDLLNELLGYGKVGGGTVFRAFGNAAKENPIPALLIGAGCTMFLAEKTGLTQRIAASAARASRTGEPFPRGAVRVSGEDGSAAQSVKSAAQSVRSAVSGAADHVQGQASSLAAGARDRAASVGSAATGAAASVGDAASSAARSIGDEVADAAASVGEAASSAAEQARRSAGGARDMASGAMDQAGKTAQGLGETMQEYSDAVGEQVANTADRARRQAASLAEQAGKQAKSLVADQPLLAAAVGLAIGAVIAAVLPRTKAEDELLGETSDAIKETLGEVADDQYQVAKEAAGNVAERAKAVSQEEGLTPGSVAGVARSVGDKVKRVVTETASAAGSELDEKFNPDKQV
jgi:ElaB/YqjD/DUF883 family membrane-anchored ribosome-binding protein